MRRGARPTPIAAPPLVMPAGLRWMRRASGAFGSHVFRGDGTALCPSRFQVTGTTPDRDTRSYVKPGAGPVSAFVPSELGPHGEPFGVVCSQCLKLVRRLALTDGPPCAAKSLALGSAR